MSDDHRELIEQIRTGHSGCGHGNDGQHCSTCHYCGVPTPCLPAYLADALDTAKRRAAELEQQNEALRDEIRDTRAWAVETGRAHDALRERAESAESQLAATEGALARAEAERDRAKAHAAALTASARAALCDLMDGAGKGLPPHAWVPLLRTLSADVAVQGEELLESLTRELAAAREALRQCGVHASGCAMWAREGLVLDRPCTCGLAAALAGQGTGEETG